METTKTERDPHTGRAVAVTLTVKVGREMVTFRDEVSTREIEAIARLRSEANVMRRAIEAQVAKNAEVTRTGFPSLLQWFEHWHHYRYMRGLWGPGITGKGRETKILELFRFIDEKYHRVPMDSFTPAMLTRISQHAEVTHAPTTSARFIQMVRTMFNDAVRYGWEDGSGNDVPWRARANPAALLRVPKDPPKHHRTLTSDELCAVLEASERRHGGMHWTTRTIAIMATLGLRIGEALALRWEQITLTPGGEHAGVITWRSSERKAGIGLRLPIPHALLRYFPPLAAEGRVLTNKYFGRGRTQIDVANELRAAAADAGIDPTGLTTHCLRHSFAHAVYAQAGTVTADVARAMGHTSEATTRRYLRDVDDLNRIGNAIASHAHGVLQ